MIGKLGLNSKHDPRDTTVLSALLPCPPLPAPPCRSVAPLSWDTGLAVDAQNWANACAFQHSAPALAGQVGENISECGGTAALASASHSNCLPLRMLLCALAQTGAPPAAVSTLQRGSGAWPAPPAL